MKTVHGAQVDNVKMAVTKQSTIENDHHQQLPCVSNIQSIRKESASNVSASAHAKSKFDTDSNINSEGKTTIVRKRLGCQRALKDMLSPEEQQVIKGGNLVRRDGVSGRQQLPRKQSRPLREIKPQRRLIFTSPRVISSDEDLFPSNHSLYKKSSDRWQQISDQAGSHRQDGTVMNIGRRPSTAMAFRMGMIGCAAVRVRSLNLWLDHEKDTLPDWLKMISEIFVNLEHLTLTEDVFPGEDDMAVSARMRRLYVLSILPNLKSIDDMVVTPKERKLANPGGCSDQLELNRDKLKSPNSQSMSRNIDQDIRSRIVSVPLSTDTDSVGSSRINGIEVEFLEDKFGDVRQTETGTTASSSPANSDSTITATDFDSHYVSKVHSIDHGEKEPNSTEELEASKQFEPNGDKNGDLKLQNTVSNSVPRENNILSEEDLKNKVASTKVHAFHNDLNNSIELVSVATADQECPVACDVLNFQKNETTPKVRFPFSSGDTKIAPDVPTDARQNSMTTLRNKERETKNSNRETFTPKAFTRKACTPVQRQSKVVVSTPQAGCCLILRNDPCSSSKFSFPASNQRVPKNKTKSSDDWSGLGFSANQQLPPSKSLSSPFPMQFRERQKPSSMASTTDLVVKTSDSTNYGSEGVETGRCCPTRNEMEIIANSLSVNTGPISSPKTLNRVSKTAQKGELPPPCPFGNTRRKTAADYQSKKRNSRNRNQKSLNNALRETARAISVMDLDDEEEFFDNCTGDE